MKASDSNNTFSTPDFAFPETVGDNAKTELDKALKTGDNLTALKAAIQLSISKVLVSNDNYKEELNIFSDLAERLPSPYNQLALLLEAQVYKDIYSSDSWKFNRRTLPLTPVPEDVKEWSRDLFAAKVRELIEEVFANTSAAKEMPVNEIKEITEHTQDAERMGMTVYDFMTVKAFGLLSPFAEGADENIIPFGYGASGNKKTELSTGQLRDKIFDENIARNEAQHKEGIASAMSWYKLSSMYGESRQKFAAECLEKYKDTPYCGWFILSVSEDYWKAGKEGDDSDLLYNERIKNKFNYIRSYLQRYPKCFNDSALRKEIRVLSSPNIGLKLDKRIYPGQKSVAQVSAGNIFDFYVLVVKLPDSYFGESLSFNKIAAEGEVVAYIPVKFTGEIPEINTTNIELPPLQSGVYVLQPSSDRTLSGIIRDKGKYSEVKTFNVSKLAMFSTLDRTTRQERLYVVDGLNQAPLKGVKVVMTPRNNGKKPILTLYTDAEGSIMMPSGGYDLNITQGNDRFEEFRWSWNFSSGNVVSREGKILTDLSIYRPGDDVQFAAYVYTRHDREMMADRYSEVKILLKDANYQIVDSLVLKTDKFGRAEGKFTLPTTGLLGKYRLEMTHRYNNNSGICSQDFVVAEYKAPAFYVTVDGTEEAYKIGDVVRISGTVKTYSGMPLADADVKFDVKYTGLFRFGGGSGNANYGGSVKTDGAGKFSIELPTEGLRNTSYAYGGYSLSVSATSPAGETQEAPMLYFSLGTAYRITPSVPDKIEAGEESYQLAVKVTDIVGNPVVKTVYYRIREYGKEDGGILKSGEFESPVFMLESSDLQSGKYTIEFSLNERFEESANQVNASGEFIVYRMDDKRPPVETPLWVPEERIIAAPGVEHIKVKFGTSYNNSYIFAIISDCEKEIERKWIVVNDGITELEVHAPATNNRVSVSLCGMYDFDSEERVIEIIPRIQVENIRITAETFRDRITPGAKESWKFHFSLFERSLTDIPVAAVMSNKALNALAPFRWQFDPASQIGYISNNRLRLESDYYSYNLDIRLGRSGSVEVDSATFPEWNFYGLSLYNAMQRRIHIRGSRGVVSSDGAIMEESVCYAAAPMMSDLKMAKNEAADADNPFSTGNTSDGKTDETSDEQDTELRKVDYPLAFFMPMLATDEKGDAVVNFTVPQFNGTWQFQIMGYSADVKGAVSVLNSVASKPVMAQMNAPRFVRTGDEVSIAAMLFNNDIKSLYVSGKIEIFDPATGDILKSYVSEAHETAAAASQKISMEYTVPDSLNCIGVRVYAFGGDFSDGEQTILPVYPSSTPVLEAKTFYIAPGMESFAMQLPKAEESNMTLQYCDNPIWEVVTALPEISEPKSSNVLSLVYSLYGNAIGAGLAREYPEIVEAIKVFADPANSQDSTLVSNLEKNQDLKNVVLNNTPWVRSAASETMRMQSLVKYADSNGCEEIIETILKEMKKLQNADGGWSWCSGMESSRFITGRVLLHLGMLKDMGYLPQEAEGMALQAINYNDAECVKEFERYRKNGWDFPYESMRNYLYIRSNFKIPAVSDEFGKMKEEAIKAIAAQWKATDIYDKATAATLLSREGYSMEARTILESLRQYATVSEDKGMWFDNLSSSFAGWNKLITTAQVLEAYTAIEPQSPNVDLLRQWLLITKQAENWGDDRETSEVIHAILSSGTKWTVPSEAPEVYIGNEPLATGHIAVLTGSFTVGIQAGDEGELRIARSGAGPAWGGVITQYVAPIADVKSNGIPELTIEKNIYSIINDADGTTAVSGNLKVGDRVRVTLTVTCDRDLEYVAVMDARSACLEPAEQLSGYSQSDGIWMYKEVRDDSTNMFIPFLGKGTHVISYDCYLDRVGEYSLGIASAQSQYAPTIAAHSAGRLIKVGD